VAGCVLYEANAVTCFSKDTVIVPELRTMQPLTHVDLRDANHNDRLQIVGSLPTDLKPDFFTRLITTTPSAMQRKPAGEDFCPNFPP
jgi:fructose-1-phosphate kinase PfkB-like protein